MATPAIAVEIFPDRHSHKNTTTDNHRKHRNSLKSISTRGFNTKRHSQSLARSQSVIRRFYSIQTPLSPSASPQSSPLLLNSAYSPPHPQSHSPYGSHPPWMPSYTPPSAPPPPSHSPFASKMLSRKPHTPRRSIHQSQYL